MMSSEIRRADTVLTGNIPATTAASRSGGTHAVWLNGIGAQFTGHSSGLSGEQRKAHHKRVLPHAVHLQYQASDFQQN